MRDVAGIYLCLLYRVQYHEVKLIGLEGALRITLASYGRRKISDQRPLIGHM